MGLSIPILGCRQTHQKGTLFPRPKFPACFVTCHWVCSDVGEKEEDLLRTVSRNCSTELYKKALNIIKLKASPKIIFCCTEALKRWLSEPGGEERSCLQGLKQACCHYPAFICELASPSPPAVTSLNKYPLPASSVSLEYEYHVKLLCWSDFPRPEADFLMRGTEGRDGLPCLSAPCHPVRLLSAPWPACCPFPGGSLEHPWLLFSRERKEQSKKLGLKLLPLKSQSFRKSPPPFSVLEILTISLFLHCCEKQKSL